MPMSRSGIMLPGAKRLKVEPCSSMGFSWREEGFSDFDCKLGERTYKLHRVILATGPRSARYFKAILNEAHPFKESTHRKSDLSELLPQACWSYFEMFLDFVYMSNVTFTPENICPLLKIADILDVPELLMQGANALDDMIQPFDKQTEELLEGALNLKVEPVIEMTASVVSAKFLETLIPQLDGNAAKSLINSLMYRLKRAEPQDNNPWDPDTKARQIKIQGPYATHGSEVGPNGYNSEEAYLWGTVLGKDGFSDGIHFWRVRVTGSRRGSADENGFAFGIGLVIQEKLSKREADDDFLGHMVYAYIALTGQSFSFESPLNSDDERVLDYGPQYEQNDIIGIQLDLNRQTIEFFKNDISCGVAFKKIPKGTYRLGVSLHNPTWGVTFLNHERLSDISESHTGGSSSGKDGTEINVSPKNHTLSRIKNISSSTTF